MVPVNSGVTALSPHCPTHSLRRGKTPSQSAQTQTSAGETTTSSAEADFRKLFSGAAATAAEPVVSQNAAPTAESVFGPDPWLSNPAGIGPAGSYSFNPLYFATPQTAAKVAQMLGGTVVASNQLVAGGSFTQLQPNQMVQLPDGRQINAGLVAAFYTHGYPQSYIDQLITGVINGA